jgi:CubicO group peptidase (beta-lactamase class C family)
VLVLKDGKVVHKKGYGLADLEKEVPITPETTFELASMSKQFTATAIMVLHDQGKLSFDDDVRKFLPGLPVYDPKRPIRIRDLLNHTSGLKDYPYNLATNAEVFKWLVNRKKLKRPTGNKYDYCNSGYVTLALVVEAASKKSFHTFLRDEVFKPLGMKSSVAFESRKVLRKQPVLGYGRLEKLKDFKGKESAQVVFEMTKRDQVHRVDEETLVVGDGSIWSNLDDLARWDQAVRDGRIVKADTWKEAFTNLWLDNGKNPEEDYGFGWNLHFGPDGKLIQVEHGGSWTGFSTQNSIYLNDGLCIVLLCNIWHFNLGKIEDGIHDIFVSKKKANP